MADPAAQPRVPSRLSNSAKLSNSIARRVHREVRFGDYILGSTLGQGEFGKVKLGWRKDGKQPEQVAIKLIRKDTVPPKSSRETKVFREINVLKILTHPNIVRLEQVIQNNKYIGIVLEYASGGELFDHILTHRYLKDSVACRLFAQLVSGVHYLHSKCIVHRDLKLENLLLDKHKNIIITDFGFANSFHNNDLMSTSCGSPCYAAPELVVSDSKYVGQKVDVWSCGVILYAMLAGYLPFDDDPANPDGDNITQLYKYITSTPLTFPEYVHPMPRDLLRKILVPDPNRRVDLQSVRQHSWLAPHAHFLSVTPQEWDQSYLASSATYKKPQPAQPAGQDAVLTRSQSVQVKSSTSGGVPGLNASPYLSSTTELVSQPLQTPAIISTAPTTPTPVQVASAAFHNRRHSVQVGYTKGVTHSQTARVRSPLGTADTSSSDDVLASLDIPPGPTTDEQRKPVIATISETAKDDNPMPLPATPSEPLQQSKTMPNRLPAARKPRPTSFQPTSAGFYSTESVNRNESPMNFHMPMSSEPRVGVSQGSALPGEISRPSSFRSNTSTSQVLAINDSTNKGMVKNQSPAVSSTSELPAEANDKTITLGDLTQATADLTLSYNKPVPAIPNLASATPVTSKPRLASRSHRRGNASVSYGADKFFSKILGGGSSSPPHNRRHSVVTASSAHSTESQNKDSKERKRFSLLSFYSSYGDNTPQKTTVNIDPTPVLAKSSKASNRSGSTSRSDERKILEPPASDSLNQRQNRASPPRRDTVKSNHKYQQSSGGPAAKEQSAARKVVEFFKRRSRIA